MQKIFLRGIFLQINEVWIEALICAQRCHSIMAQTTMAHASMASPLWRRSGFAHSGMARSSTAQVRCGIVSVRRIPVWRSSGVALFRYDAFQYGAGPVRRISVWRSSDVALRNIVLNVPCRVRLVIYTTKTKYSNYTN